MTYQISGVKRCAALLCAATILLPPGALVCRAEQTTASNIVSTVETEQDTYSAYLTAHAAWSLAETDATAAALSTDGVSITSGQSLTVAVDVPQDALYELQLTYIGRAKNGSTVAFSVDGSVPFSEADSITFPTFWTNGESKQDEGGDEYAPEQVQSDRPESVVAADRSGQQEHPYRVALSAGRHEISIAVTQGEMTVLGITVSAPEQPENYRQPAGHEPCAEQIVIEGESADRKSARTLSPLSDGSSAAVQPNDPVQRRLNYIGGTNWADPGDSLSWTFFVKRSGYYSLSFVYRQNQIVGGVAFRHLKIDGKTPFAEAERVRFPYGTSWRTMTFGNGDDPYLLWLEAGEHTLSMTVTPGATAEIYGEMKMATAAMGDLYVDITKVVGETVDIYRSYELFAQIPSFNDRLEQIVARLDQIAEKMSAMQEQKSGSSVSTVQNARRVVQTMLDKPYSAHEYKSQFYDAYTNLSALMGTMADQPLDIDRIVLSGDGAETTSLLPSFGEKLRFGFARFFHSYATDYQQKKADGEGLTLWLSWGRDQAQAVNALIQDDFVRRTGIPVQVELANATLIQAILSGSGPDCMLQLQRTEPVNLAMRGVLVDLDRFADQGLAETLDRFGSGADLPYRYNGKLYALPDTQSFYMMFARTDILASMGLTVPTTWDEFLHTAMLLQRSDLEVSIPYTKVADSGAVNGGIGGMSLYPTLLVQAGLPLYRDDASACTLSDRAQADVFVQWTNWYTRYKLPVVTDFFNRFRVGTAPLGIAAYTVYTQLEQAAPEIRGRWQMYALPATVTADGSSNAAAGSGTGCAITTLSREPEKAWQFLQWWTSAETQRRYSESIEGLLGPLGRVATANTEALATLGWDEKTAEQLVAAKQNVVEIPEVPGGYYTARGLDQAYWNVVEQGRSATDQLTKWAAIIDREIQRKTAEYSDK